MRKQLFMALIAMVLVALSAAPLWSQAMATVKGSVVDQDGKPMVGAKVELLNKENGQKYNLKTDKKGQFFSIGVASGNKYKVTLFDPQGKQVTFYDNVPITISKDENVIDFNLKQMGEQQAAGVTPAAPGQPAAQPKLTPEQQKQVEAAVKARAEQEKEVVTVKNLNQMLATSKAAADAGNFDQAIQTMQQATATDPTRDILWAVLGDFELRATKKPGTDAASRTKLNTGAAEAYQKAITACNVPKPATSCKDVASYHNNLGQALVGEGKVPEAIAEYEAAAKLNPTNAGQYYYNEGAVLTNMGKTDDANAAFDKAIAADPTRADAYYQKGVNLIAKATVGKDGKIVAPPEAEKNIQKYLELQPSGPYAASAKELLDTLGATVQTSYGSKGKKK